MNAAPDTRDLAPISLDELVSRASLQTRVDRKYLLTRAQAGALLGRIPEDTRVLEIDGRRLFGYSSLYLDTPDLTSYHLAARRRRRRFKVRVREYLDTDSRWLEVKTRQGRHTVKDRLLLRPGAAKPVRLDADGVAYVDGVLRAADVVGPDPATLRPALHTRYRRSTLHLADSDSRVTLDVDLTFAGCRTGGVLAAPEFVVVETKTAANPCAVDRILWSLGARPVRLSKYGTGLAALQPELPQATWRRIIRTQLRPGRRFPERFATDLTDTALTDTDLTDTDLTATDLRSAS